jgi:hypothetical protein
MVWPWKATCKAIEDWFTSISHMLAESFAWTKHPERMIISAKWSVYGTEKMYDGSRAVDFNKFSKLLQFSIGSYVTIVITEVGEQRIVPWHILTNWHVSHSFAFHVVFRRQYHGC